mmetsp:Transcript_13098/g.27965  ORF Transcript_13098/g.27965 Transcript_13098/m.27965 type:complete len:98 (+) Transcript_13098:97-390(+)
MSGAPYAATAQAAADSAVCLLKAAADLTAKSQPCPIINHPTHPYLALPLCTVTCPPPPRAVTAIQTTAPPPFTLMKDHHAQFVQVQSNSRVSINFPG